MDTLGGLKATGRKIEGPASDLSEFEASGGRKLTAIVYHPAFHGAEDLTTEMDPVLDFLREPGIDGISPLLKHAREEAAFVYPTGNAWSVAELVQVCADLGEPPGVRAGLELCYLASQILLEGAEAGQKVGIYNHGSLSPWRLMLKADGSVHVIGFGIPQVEIHQFVDNEASVPREDSFRYCPPERLEGEPEDISSDLFTLALIGCELMTGRPVYDGLVSDIRQQATRAEGAYRLYKWRDQLPERVREVFSRALKYDIDSRHKDPLEFVYAVHDILNSPDADGPSLYDVVQQVRTETSKGGALVGGKTTMMSREQLAALAAEIEGEEPIAIEPPKRPRPSQEPEPEPDDGEPQRWESRGGRKPRGGGGRSDARKSLEERLGRSSDAKKSLEERLGRSSDAKKDLRERLGRSDDAKKDLRERLGRSSDAKKDLRERLGRSGDAKKDLRERLGRSSDAKKDLRERLGRSDAGPDEPKRADDAKKDLKERLRRSSDPKQDLRERLRRSDSPRAEDRRDDDRPAEPPAAQEPDDAPTDAASLLARLRSSVGRKRSPEAPSATAAPVEPAAPEPVEAEPDPAPAASDEAPAPMEASPPPAASEPRAEPPRAAEEPSPSPAPTAGAAPLSPDQVRIRLSVDGAAPRPVGLQVDAPLADCTTRLVQAVAGVPTDLTGQLTGWYRLEQGGRRWPGTERGRVIDPDEVVVLRFVPNRIVRVTFEVQGLDTPVRFQAPVGTAVPARSLVEHLARWLALPDDRWALHVEGQALLPTQILDEYEPGDELVVVVKR